MAIVLIISVCILIIAVPTYPKWSYTEYYKRCQINALHPDWYPRCGINFFKKDPQWFIDHGYKIEDWW